MAQMAFLALQLERGGDVQSAVWSRYFANDTANNLHHGRWNGAQSEPRHWGGSLHPRVRL